MNVSTISPGGPEVRLSHLPQRLAGMLHQGRQRLERSRDSEQALNLSLQQAEDALARCNWQELLVALEQIVPADILPYIDRSMPTGFQGVAGGEPVTVTIRIPQLSPIEFPMVWQDGAWQRGQYAAFEETFAWSVVLWDTPDEPADKRDFTNTFSLALALAEEAEQHRHSLPRKQAHGLAPAPGHGEGGRS